MNRQQAKARFTELTGLATDSSSLYAHALTLDWLARALAYVADNTTHWQIDCRHREFWVLLNEYLDSYCEIGGKA